VLRHEFQPGRLVAGIFLAGAGVAYVGDADGAWEAPWFAIFPIVIGGLCLAAVTGLLTRAIRRHRPLHAVRQAGPQEARADAVPPAQR
jgi:drug/metabolite transporter (DMT)-like permease